MTGQRLRLNRHQKDGVARVLDGFVIASGVAIYAFLGGHSIMTGAEALGTFLVGLLCESYAIYLRRD